MTLKEFCEKHKDDYIAVRYPNEAQELKYGKHIVEETTSAFWEVSHIEKSNYNYIVDVKIRNLVITNNL